MAYKNILCFCVVEKQRVVGGICPPPGIARGLAMKRVAGLTKQNVVSVRTLGTATDIRDIQIDMVKIKFMQ